MSSSGSKPAIGPNSENLVWIDLEMTGLDPSVDAILQAALVVTSSDLVPLADVAVDIHQSDAVLSRMAPVVREMHTRTGLIDRVRRSSVTVSEAERLLIETVQNWCLAPAVLCGNSVWTDRRFVARYMAQFDGLLHYRMVDVSSIKVLAQRWYGLSAVFEKPIAGAHDATVDIRNSIEELRHYRRTLFRGSWGHG